MIATEKRNCLTLSPASRTIPLHANPTLGSRESQESASANSFRTPRDGILIFKFFGELTGTRVGLILNSHLATLVRQGVVRKSRLAYLCVSVSPC
jgi:hypothetical protein